MKILKYLLISSGLIVLAISCQKGIDPISAVAPGADTAAPVIAINYPSEGTLIRVPDAIATISIKVNASDDIELKKVSLQMDGTEITSYSTFKDYRVAMISYDYTSLADGDHTLTVVATDLTDKSSTKSVNFKKVAPYAPLDGEVFYMPFDGDYNELVTFKAATMVGTPGFAAGKVGQAYAGATGAYLTFPTAGLLGTEFSVAFWYKWDGAFDRGGMLAISRSVIAKPPADSTRNSGFRMARENASPTAENLFADLGINSTEVWLNPYIVLTSQGDWMHIAITVSTSKATVYINGQVVKETALAEGINWRNCNLLSIGSGSPNWDYWNHLSDLSLMDELRIFKKALSATEVAHVYAMK